MDLKKIKLLEDLNEEVQELEASLNERLREKRKAITETLVENAFSQFKDFFEKQDFKVNSLSGSPKIFTASYKTTSFTLMYHERRFVINKSGKEICTVGISEKIPGNRGGFFSSSGGSPLDNDINIANQKIKSLKYSLDNLDSFDCTYQDNNGNYEYQSFTDILNKYFK